jgi:hypothetical protein
MAAHAGRLLLPLAIGVLVLPAAVSAQARHGDTTPDPYHRDYHTAVRHDPPPPAHAPAWGSWADTPAPWWNQPTSPAPVTGTGAGGSDAFPAPGHHGRPDPNLRMAVVPDTQTPYGWSGDQVGNGWDGAHAPDDRMRHGWRAGWRGAAPGWGGVWWYGWGGDWPAYAADGGDSSWSGSRGWRGSPNWGGAGAGSGWHGTFSFEQGWGGGGQRVIALPAPRGQ